MTHRSITTILVATAILTSIAITPTSARTASHCYRIRCDPPTSHTCFWLTNTGGIDIGISGVATITEIPCPTKSNGAYVDPNGWVNLPIAPWGATNAQFVYDSDSLYVTIFDDSQTYDDFEMWEAAAGVSGQLQ